MRLLHDMVTDWWKGQLGGAGTALDVLTGPVEVLYRAGTGVRNSLYDTGALETTALGVPVISVGNITVGGTGKTPVTAWLARILRDAGARPAVVHGGYADDEPALHKEMNADIPVHIGRDRVATARVAIRGGANIIVLDDAFQHRAIARDLDIVLIAAETWDTHRRMLPRGPWRENVDALRRADWVVVTRRTAPHEQAMRVLEQIRGIAGSDSGRAQREVSNGPPQLAIISVEPGAWRHHGGTSAPPEREAILVTAIGSPDAFLANARTAGATIRDHHFYRDHHTYTRADADDILRSAGTSPIIATAKDWVKLKHLLPSERVWILEQRVLPEDACDILLHEAGSLMR